jgi:carbohydrate kinase (thermoresistant glucokinase family)
MPFVPGLRSEYSLTGRLVHFGRMLDKIRLDAAGRLPADYKRNLGIGFDGRTCTFLGVDYAMLKARVLAGGCDEEILDWAHAQGGVRTNDQCNLWNRFMMKVGWRDDRTPILRERIATCGLETKPIETFFDLNDFDEGRDPVATRAWDLNEPRVLLLMGVAGSGKTTVGRTLAASLGWRFTDADDFHPPANISKISAGSPLTDEDRGPWLAAVRAHIDARLAARESTVLACSVLKEAYRDILVGDPGCVKLIHLKGPAALIKERLENRANHWAGPALLESQLATLEEPRHALVLDITESPEVLAARIRSHYSL